jgi:hypothetical protein
MMADEMQQGRDTFIELFRTVEAALAIVGEKTLDELKMTLDTAELETNLVVTKAATGGFKIDAIGLDASGKKSAESTHGYKLTLRRRPKRKGDLGPNEIELAEAIFSIAAATRAINDRTSDFFIDEATVTVDLTRSTEGGLKVFGGGEGKSENLCRIVMTFKLREL